MRRAVPSLLVAWVVGCSTGNAARPADPGGTTPGAAPVTPGGGEGGASTPGGADDGGPGAAGSLALPCAVDGVFARNCRTCHSSPPGFGAPMPLVTYADLHAPAKSDPSNAVYQLVGVRIHDDAHPMPQPPNPRLSASDTGTLDAWIAASAPAGAACSASPDDAGTDDAGSGLSCSPDLHILPASKYALPSGVGDQYVCYGFDASPSTKRHLIAFAPRIDDHSVVHHVSLLESDTAVSSTPAPCDMGSASTTWRPVYGWAPGVGTFELPPEAGFPEDATTHFVVQVHYSNPTNLQNQVDGTGFDVCTTATLRPNDADIMAFGTTSFTIPPLSVYTRTCTVQVPYYGQTTHLFAALPHMHLLGASISSSALPADGGPSVDLGTVSHWSFGSQAWLPVADVLNPYDTVTTTCSWDNTTSSSVSFGENTTNEMCFSFVMYYPAITSSAWNWSYPAVYSTCQ
jgi:hypothetical protein